MSLHRALRFALPAALTAALAAACGATGSKAGAGAGGGGGTGTSGSGAMDAGSDAPATVTVSVAPATKSATVTLGVTPAPVAFKATAVKGGGAPEDVTAKATWSISPAIGSVAGGVVKLTGNGGKATVTATYEGASGSAALTVELTGDVFGAGTSATTKAAFAAATPDATPANAPAIEYPEDGVVLPGNLPPIDAQWTQGAADDTAFRVHLASPGLLDVYFYTTGLDLVFPAAPWAAVAATTADADTQITVEALGAGGTMVRASAPRTLTIASDGIDQSAIYVWQPSSGSFRVLDVIAGTDVALPNSEPVLASGQPCSGCHRISRDGKRFSYTFNGANFEFGSLEYDAKAGMFTPTITPSTGFRGTYATFNPNEATQVPAMLVATLSPNDVQEQMPGTVALTLINPEDGTTVPSNVAAAIAQIDPAVGLGTSMPDWSPDGSFVVFAAYDSTTEVRLLGDDIVQASIVEMPVSYDAAKGFTFGKPKTLVKALKGASITPDVGENDFLPTISPDGEAVAFTRAAGYWSLKTQTSLLNLSGQIVVVRRSDGQVLPLVKGSSGPGTTLSSTWPQWAPTLGARYAWLAYAAERPYGHLLTTASPENAQCGFVQGQQLCKHLWVTAIDRKKLAAGKLDPSAAPFFVPGQTLAAQYVSPQWTRAVIMPPQ